MWSNCFIFYARKSDFIFRHDWLNGHMGILVNDGLIMVSHLNSLIKEKGLSIATLVEGLKIGLER